MYGLRADIGTSTEFVVYPGCSKQIDVCEDKFNNVATFGGFPWVPLNNPVMEEF